MKRRKFLRRIGQTSGLFLLGAGMQPVLLSCAGNVSTPEANSTASPQGNLISSSGLRSPGLLQWGSDSVAGAPYVFNNPTNPSQLVGYEVEIAEAIAKLMGAKATQVQTNYPQLAAALDAKRFDFILNGWEVTPDREKTQIFSQPYYRYGQQIVVRSDDPRFKDVNETSDFTLKDLAGMAVGTGLGFKAEEILRADPQIKTRAYDGNLPFDDLAQKRIDAILIDIPMVAYYVLGAGPEGKPNPALKPVGKPLYLNNYVIAFNKSDPKAATLQQEIDQALQTLKQDGTLKDIYQRWKLWNDQQAEIGIT